MPKNNTAADTPQTTISFSPPDEKQLDISALETWLWDAACVIRGADENAYAENVTPKQARTLNSVFDQFPDYQWDVQKNSELQRIFYIPLKSVEKFHVRLPPRLGRTPTPPTGLSKYAAPKEKPSFFPGLACPDEIRGTDLKTRFLCTIYSYMPPRHLRPPFNP